jgi:isopentenyldiphosphate isomerase
MIVDVVDSKNRAIAKARRAVLFQEHLNFRTVHVVLHDRAGRFLLQRLSPNHPRNPNRLGSSAAGYLYAAESYFEAAKRKLREELCVRIRIRSVGRLEMTDQGSQKFVEVFVGALREPPILADSLVAELVYMHPHELASLMSRDLTAFTPTFVTVYQHLKNRVFNDG